MWLREFKNELKNILYMCIILVEEMWENCLCEWGCEWVDCREINMVIFFLYFILKFKKFFLFVCGEIVEKNKNNLLKEGVKGFLLINGEKVVMRKDKNFLK